MNAAWPIAGLMIVGFLAGCSAPNAGVRDQDSAKQLEAQGEPVRHHVHAFADHFEPNDLAIRKGDLVLWHLHDGNHEILAHKEGDPANAYTFQAPLTSGGEATHVFYDAGTYNVFCKKHSTGMTEGMAMRVSVV